MNERWRQKEKLLRRETKREKYSRAGDKRDKQGEITEAVRWKLARTCQISLNLHKSTYQVSFAFIAYPFLCFVYSYLLPKL